jgi:hypothetical protein
MQIVKVPLVGTLPRPPDGSSNHYFTSHTPGSHALYEEHILLSENNLRITWTNFNRLFPTPIRQVLFSNFSSRPTLCIFFDTTVLFHTWDEEYEISLETCLGEFRHAWSIPTGVMIQVRDVMMY